MSNTARNYDLDDSVREILINAGFMPIETAGDDFEIDLPAADAKTLTYFEGRGWLAFRIETNTPTPAYTIARWGEDGIEIAGITGNGLITAEARFTANDSGAAWLAAVLYNA